MYHLWQYSKRLPRTSPSQSEFRQVAQLSQRDRAAGWVSFGQKWKTGTGRQYFADIIGLSLTTVQSCRMWWKNAN